jgi:TrmH family RNA methyltransferase
MNLDNICIILVNPKFPGNVGAAARAMKAMGLRRFRLVNPCDFRSEEARWMAHGAEDILLSARSCRTLAGALRGTKVVVGTTNRHRHRHIPTHFLRECAAEISRISDRNRTAILFGREDTGLLNEHMDECDYILRIPQSVKHPSLNLAQSVMVVCYELFTAPGLEHEPFSTLATRIQLDRMYAHIRRTIDALGYDTRKLLPERIMQHVRKILGRTTLTPTESDMIRGLCTQIEKRIREKKNDRK